MVPHSPRLMLAAAALLGACGTRDRRQTATLPAPPAEFLVETQDSTFWVQSGPAGIRVRGAPPTPANYDGGYYEISLAVDARSSEAALLVGAGGYGRDLVSGDPRWSSTIPSSHAWPASTGAP